LKAEESMGIWEYGNENIYLILNSNI